MPAQKKATQTTLNQFFTPLADTSKKQTLMTKFFQSTNPTENKFQYLFEREEARKKKEQEELARQVEAEELQLKLQKQEERKRRAEERKRLQAEIHRQMEEDQNRRWEEEEKRYEGKLIIPGLYLGSRLAAKNPDWLLESVTAVLNVTHEVKNYFEGSFVKQSGAPSDENDCESNLPAPGAAVIEYKRISCEDAIEEQICQRFAEGTEFIDKVLQNHGSVLVHCREGMSRSPSMIIAYLMKFQQWSLEKAYNHVVTCNGKVRINDGFKLQLMSYEQKLFGQPSLDFFDRRSRNGTARTATRLRKRQSTRDDTPSDDPTPDSAPVQPDSVPDQQQQPTEDVPLTHQEPKVSEDALPEAPQVTGETHETVPAPLIEGHVPSDEVMSDPGTTTVEYEPVELKISCSLPDLEWAESLLQDAPADPMQTD